MTVGAVQATAGRGLGGLHDRVEAFGGAALRWSVRRGKRRLALVSPSALEERRLGLIRRLTRHPPTRHCAYHVWDTAAIDADKQRSGPI